MIVYTVPDPRAFSPLQTDAGGIQKKGFQRKVTDCFLLVFRLDNRGRSMLLSRTDSNVSRFLDARQNLARVLSSCRSRGLGS